MKVKDAEIARLNAQRAAQANRMCKIQGRTRNIGDRSRFFGVGYLPAPLFPAPLWPVSVFAAPSKF